MRTEAEKVGIVQLKLEEIRETESISEAFKQLSPLCAEYDLGIKSFEILHNWLMNDKPIRRV